MQKISDYVDKHFPYETYNPGQREAIIFAVKNILQGKKHVIIEAPTGVGKSVIATTTHKVLNELYLKKAARRWRTSLITTTKGLQSQYLAEDSSIEDLKGKKNYKCNRCQSHYGSPKCASLIQSKQTKRSDCEYYSRRETWTKRADLRLTNSAYFIRAPKTLIGSREEETRSNLLIIDECHSIDTHLVKHAAIIIDMPELEEIEPVVGKNFTGNFAGFILDIGNRYEEGDYFTADSGVREDTKVLIDRIKDKIDELEVGIKSVTNTSKAVAMDSAIETLSTWAENLGNFAWGGGEWIVEKYSYARHLNLTPVYASQVVDRSIYQKSDQFIHMSATICGIDGYMRVMNIDPSEAVSINIDNPIPRENRKVYVLNAHRVSGNYIPGEISSIVDLIIDKYGNNNGIIHTVSFKLAEEIKNESANRNNMYISNDRREINKLLSRGDDGIIVMGPSLEVGYDFKDEMSRYQIILKVPYEYLGSNYVKLNTERDNRWYARKAIIRLVQAAGRSVRGVDDYADTFIIDSNFQRLYEQNYDMFPKWFRDALIFN